MALFHKYTIGSIHRRATGLCAIPQQHVSPRYWYGTIRGECDKPGRGLATPLRSRKCGNTEVLSCRLPAHQQSEATVQERLHGKLDRTVVYDHRRAPFGATGLPPGGLARRTFVGDLLRTRTTEGCCVKR